MSHVDTVRAADDLIRNQALTVVRIEPAAGKCDGRDRIEMSPEAWDSILKLAHKHGYPFHEGSVTLSREEGAQLAHALRKSASLQPYVRRLLVTLGQNSGLMVTAPEVA